MNNKESFTAIYKENRWGGRESKSGKGSDKLNALNAKNAVIEVIKSLNIKTVLDCACGDFNWMKDVLKEVDVYYIGLDIVDELINSNNKKYYDNKTSFICYDITQDNLPQADLVICRDCLVHLSNEDIKKFLRNFIKSNSKYLLVTSFIGRTNKYLEIDSKRWRSISLMESPFSLSEPLTIYSECSKDNYPDKSLFFYERSQLAK